MRKLICSKQIVTFPVISFLAAVIGCTHSTAPQAVDTSPVSQEGTEVRSDPSERQQSISVSQPGRIEGSEASVSHDTAPQPQNRPDALNLASAIILAGGKPFHVAADSQGVDVVVRPPDTDPNVRLGISAGGAVFVTDDGFFLTAAHVVKKYPAYLCYVTAEGTSECVEVPFLIALGIVDGRDGLLLGKVNATVKSLAVAERVVVGEAVRSLGARLEQSGERMAHGSVLGTYVESNIRYLNVPGGVWSSVYHSSLLSKGFSGGAVVNASNEIIGINSSGVFTPTGAQEAWAIRVLPSDLKLQIEKSREDLGPHE